MTLRNKKNFIPWMISFTLLNTTVTQYLEERVRDQRKRNKKERLQSLKKGKERMIAIIEYLTPPFQMTCLIHYWIMQNKCILTI